MSDLHSKADQTERLRAGAASARRMSVERMRGKRIHSTDSCIVRLMFNRLWFIPSARSQCRRVDGELSSDSTTLGPIVVALQTGID